MKIGLRTIKTAISATLAMIVGNSVGLMFPTSAGIIAILSVTNTKKSSLKTGLNRLLSLALATILAYLSFSLIGFTPIAFGFYLLLFIPLAVRFNLSAGIVVSSVLVSHYLTEASLAPQLILNEFLLMTIGVGFALLLNLYMPDRENDIKEKQQKIEAEFREILDDMASFLNNHSKERDLFLPCQELKNLIKGGEEWARNHSENHLFGSNHYYRDYFYMRRTQNNILQDMLTILEKITVEQEQVAGLKDLLRHTAVAFAEENDGQEILDKIYHVYENYRNKELPKTREEFENRAKLFQFLQLFQAFIEVKADFIIQQAVTEK